MKLKWRFWWGIHNRLITINVQLRTKLMNISFLTLEMFHNGGISVSYKWRTINGNGLDCSQPSTFVYFSSFVCIKRIVRELDASEDFNNLEKDRYMSLFSKILHERELDIIILRYTVIVLDIKDLRSYVWRHFCLFQFTPLRPSYLMLVLWTIS